MPELPEVETIAGYLIEGVDDRPPILGKQICAAEIRWEGVVETPSPEEFERRIPGQTVRSISRRGKHLVLELSTDSLIMHLRMSGDVITDRGEVPPRKHDRMLLHFQDGTRLAFNNIRKFGRIWLTDQPERVLGKLGPEPLDPDFTADDLHRITHSRSRQIKYLLLDQTMLAGMGNIYTDEALHLAGIHPRTKSDSLNSSQTRDLWLAIREVLQKGIRFQGTSIDWMYRGGDYQRYLNVYGREGKNCSHCGTIIARIKVAQRSTFLCPTCQPPPSGS
jgi:formamidopyrimidine-DNA glycosylase